MRLALLAILVPATAAAAPDVSFELLDRGDSVEVIAHNVKAIRTAVSPIRQRLEVPVVGRPAAPGKVPNDATVKVIEFDAGAEPRVLSVKLGFERADVKNLARFAQAIQVGDDLHLLFPRHVPADGAVVKLPEPTLPAVVAKPEPAELVAPPKPEPKPEIVRPEPAPAALVAKPEPKTSATTLAPAPDDDGWTKLSTYGAIGLAAAGVGAWLLKRRRTAQPATSTIEVIAQRALGGKAKIVWFTAGGRDMVVAVTPNQVRMLGQWQRPVERSVPMPIVSPALPEATALAEPRPVRPLATSAAVSGILKLRRAATVQPELKVSDEVATGDDEADELWARELLAAGGRR